MEKERMTTDEDLNRYGYAPGDCWHPHCSCCDDSFIADKRATKCRQCATVTARREQGETNGVDFNDF